MSTRAKSTRPANSAYKHSSSSEIEYETGVQRVRDLRAKLRPWRNHPAVADLTEQLLLVS